MINKLLKKEKLHLSIEYLNEEGKTVKKTQQINFMASDATDEEKYSVSESVGKILIATPKSIENTFVYELVEV